MRPTCGARHHRQSSPASLPQWGVVVVRCHQRFVAITKDEANIVCKIKMWNESGRSHDAKVLYATNDVLHLRHVRHKRLEHLLAHLHLAAALHHQSLQSHFSLSLSPSLLFFPPLPPTLSPMIGHFSANSKPANTHNTSIDEQYRKTASLSCAKSFCDRNRAPLPSLSCPKRTVHRRRKMETALYYTGMRN